MKKWQEVLAERGDVFIAGGSARDMLVGRRGDPSDTDLLVTGIPETELMDLISPFGYARKTGKSFSVILFRESESGESFHIAVPRKRPHPGSSSIVFDHRLGPETDLSLRDFTVNAVAINIRSGEIISPSGGVEDIKARIIRAAGPGVFKDDPLRMLRGIRLSCELQFKIEPGTLELIRERAQLISSVSPDRTGEELRKLMSRAPDPGPGFSLLKESGILDELIPELNSLPPRESSLCFRACGAAAAVKQHIRWAALFYKVPGEARYILKRLRFSGTLTDRITRLLCSRPGYTSDWPASRVRAFISKAGAENITDALDFEEAIAEAEGRDAAPFRELRARAMSEIKAKHPTRIEDLKVGGEDVMRSGGVPPGPLVGLILRELLRRVLEDPALNSRERLLQAIREEAEKNQPSLKEKH